MSPSNIFQVPGFANNQLQTYSWFPQKKSSPVCLVQTNTYSCHVSLSHNVSRQFISSMCPNHPTMLVDTAFTCPYHPTMLVDTVFNSVRTQDFICLCPHTGLYCFLSLLLSVHRTLLLSVRIQDFIAFCLHHLYQIIFITFKHFVNTTLVNITFISITFITLYHSIL